MSEPSPEPTLFFFFFFLVIVALFSRDDA